MMPPPTSNQLPPISPKPKTNRPQEFHHPQSGPPQFHHPQSGPQRHSHPQSGPQRHRHPQSGPQRPRYPQSGPQRPRYPQSGPPQFYHPQSGPQGYNPESGPQGYNPESGPQGYNPQSGPQGYNPKSGPQGYNPQPGQQGYNPQSGPQGYNPQSGPQVYNAPSGPQGYNPQSGPQGPQRPRYPQSGQPQFHHPQSGPQRPRYPQSGPQQPRYPQSGPPQFYHPQSGPQGYNPQLGSQGYNPQLGPQGFNDPSGPQGYNPQLGPQGYNPQSGPQGYNAQLGPQGFNDPSGPQGCNPQLGPQGYNPQSGPQGYNNSRKRQPEICKFFNVAGGCAREKCPFLHICRHFIESTCKFGCECKRNHDINYGDNLNILMRYGINVNLPPDVILMDVKEMLHNEAESPDGDCNPPPLNAGLTDSLASPPLYPSAVDFQGARPKIPSGGFQQEQGPADRPHYSKNKAAAGRQPRSKTKATEAKRQSRSSSRHGTKGESRSKSGVRQRMPSDNQGKPRASNEICMSMLRGKCWHGVKCFYPHKNMIYQWQFMKDEEQTWEDFDEDTNTDIETNYCLPEKLDCLVRLEDRVVQINFTQPMTGTCLGETNIHIQRLSTPSSEGANSRPQFAQWLTEWLWYWQNPQGDWIQYGQQDTVGSKSNFNSQALEAKYLEDQNGSVEFETNSFTYKLDFGAMTQVNIALSTTREVRRRPLFFKKDQLKDRVSAHPLMTKALEVPKNWSEQKFRTQKALFGHYREVKVEETSEEYKAIQLLFSKTVPGEKIQNIKRIENGELWSNYSMKKGQMDAKSGHPTKQLQLFHGTDSSYIDPISHQGFDFRFSGSRVGTRLGKGSYFARDASYSAAYSPPDDQSNATMFVARVLVGEFTLGQNTFVRPPAKSQNNPHDLFDSCVNDESDPSIYVLFSLEQSYPEYLIKFKREILK